MQDVGLLPGDKAVIDRSKVASIGDIVLAVINNEFTIKTLSRKKVGSIRLLPANSTGEFAPIEIKEGMDFEIWGVVTGSFRLLSNYLFGGLEGTACKNKVLNNCSILVISPPNFY